MQKGFFFFDARKRKDEIRLKKNKKECVMNLASGQQLFHRIIVRV